MTVYPNTPGFNRGLAMPSGPSLTDEEVERIAEPAYTIVDHLAVLDEGSAPEEIAKVYEAPRKGLCEAVFGFKGPF